MSNAPSLESLLSTLRALKPEMESRYKVATIALFGSFVHHAQTPSSDVDVLVSFKQPPSLLQFIELENLLSENLGVKVDLVMREALKPNIGRRILEDIVSI